MTEDANRTLNFARPEQPPRKAVAVKARVPKQPRPVLVGTVMVAPEQPRTDTGSLRANVARGQVVFYREQARYEFFYHRISKTVGCDLAAWERAKELGAQWMVTYARAERRLVLIHAGNVNLERDYGNGRQARGHVTNCIVIENARPWDVPRPDETVTVEGK
jgi:hypothetical protein